MSMDMQIQDFSHNFKSTPYYQISQENTLLLGVISGSHEPKLHINSFLPPLVDNLLKLWNGVILKTCSGMQRLDRGALFCAACDVPAARKVCGFVGHGGTRGCLRCLGEFSTTEF